MSRKKIRIAGEKPGKSEAKFEGGKVSENILRLILDDIEAGVPPEISAFSHGLDQKTFERWISYESVSKRLTEAEARAVVKYLKVVGEKALKDGTVSMQILQTRWPETFGKASVQVRDIPKPKKDKNESGESKGIFDDFHECFHRVYPSLTLGSKVTYRMSITRFVRIIINPINSDVPRIAGKSSPCAAVTINIPMPR